MDRAFGGLEIALDFRTFLGAKRRFEALCGGKHGSKGLGLNRKDELRARTYL